MTDHTGIPTTPQAVDDARRAELGRFLRARRERLPPLAPSGRRRTPGQRREDVAAAAGISVTWYTWLEQGRDVSMSRDTMDRLTRALALDETEGRYLERIARPADLRPPRPASAPASLAGLVAGLAPHPAYAMDRVCNVVAWNEPAGALFGAIVPGDPVRGNILARLFLDPAWKRLFADWPIIARSAVAQFRAGTAAFAQDDDVTALVARLSEAAPVFRTVWEAAELAPSPDWTKVLRRGNRTECWRYTVMRPEGEARGFTVTVYLPPVSPPEPAAAT